MTCSAGNSIQLQLRIEVRIIHIAWLISIRGLGHKRHLLAQGGVAGHAQNRVCGAVPGEINDLSPRSRPHRLAVKTIFPIRVLLRVAATAGLWPERGFLFCEVGRRGTLGDNRPLPIALEKILCLLIECSDVGSFTLLAAGWEEKPDNQKK